MQKILAHTNGNRQYRSLIRHLSLMSNSNITMRVSNLHNNIFDTAHIFKPDILFYPFVEYTQEIHNYVETYHNKHKIIFYIDFVIENSDLIRYLVQTNCYFIVKNHTTQISKNALLFDYMYDDTIYYKIPDVTKNNKIAVSLSNDNAKNKILLEPLLYPNECEYPLVLFNNPEFKHPQNLGIYNEQDLNYVLNSYSYFVDIDCEFELESAAADALWCNESHGFIEQIKNKQFSNHFTNTYQNYSISNFMEKQLIPYIGL